MRLISATSATITAAAAVAPAALFGVEYIIRAASSAAAVVGPAPAGGRAASVDAS